MNWITSKSLKSVSLSCAALRLFASVMLAVVSTRLESWLLQLDLSCWSNPSAQSPRPEIGRCVYLSSSLSMFASDTWALSEWTPLLCLAASVTLSWTLTWWFATWWMISTFTKGWGGVMHGTPDVAFLPISSQWSVPIAAQHDSLRQMLILTTHH